MNRTTLKNLQDFPLCLLHSRVLSPRSVVSKPNMVWKIFHIRDKSSPSKPAPGESILFKKRGPSLMHSTSRCSRTVYTHCMRTCTIFAKITDISPYQTKFSISLLALAAATAAVCCLASSPLCPVIQYEHPQPFVKATLLS